MSPPRYGFHEVVLNGPEPGDPLWRTRTRYAILSHSEILLLQYRCYYGLFRDVFREQITFCFENLTVFVDVADTKRYVTRDASWKRAVVIEKQLTHEYFYFYVTNNKNKFWKMFE